MQALGKEDVLSGGWRQHRLSTT